VPTPAAAGGFLNYDVSANRAAGQTIRNGLFELGGFGSRGVGVSSLLTRNVGADTRVIRLDTTWTQDRPGELASLRLGDAIGGAGSWGRSVRFGGIQKATNFATQPGFISFPLPGLSGEAVLPSTVDLYVNDALRMRREVPTGPFSIQDLPVVTGRGEARLVVRDLLGREQVISQPYYASPRLLQQGLHDYSYESGFIREDFGFASNEYGRFMAAGTHRLGLTDRLTGELRGELLRDQQTLGTSGAWLWPDAGVFTASLAGSRGSGGSGELLGAGFERQTRQLSFGGNIQVATEHFAQLGLLPGQPAPKQLSQAFVGYSSGVYGSIGLSYTHQAFRDRDEVELVNASYSLSLGKLGFLSLSVLRFLTVDAKTAVSLTVTLPLDERTSASVNATTQPGSQQAQTQVQRSLPAGNGVGYRLRAGTDSELREAGVSLQNDVGTYVIEAAQMQGQTSYRGSASGGVAWLGGRPFLSRRITDSFAVVQVPDYPNVRIYADNQAVATTGGDGNALLPRLRSYEKNHIRIEQADLPLDAQIDAVEIDAVPYFRSGVLLKFPVKRSRGALITVVLENGELLPAGAVAQIVGEKDDFPAGQRGEVYLTGLAASNPLRVSWRGQSCEFTVPFPETTEPLPHLGTYTCTGVKP
jgi:outer membrane usher protein